jgi:hypothetical protein
VPKSANNTLPSHLLHVYSVLKRSHSERDDLDKTFEIEYSKNYLMHLAESICNRIINDYQYEEENYFTVRNKKMQLLRLENRENAVFSQVNILKNNEGDDRD